MRVLIIGSGGREHALAWKLKQSPEIHKLYVAPGNAGTAALAENVPLEATDIEGLVNFARAQSIDLTVVGPDDPLALGLVDAFERHGLKVFGPTKAAAKIESSKAFAKSLMKKRGIPTADFRIFNDYEMAIAYLETQQFPLFIKASGLAMGKGAVKCKTVADGRRTLEEMMVKREFGDAGAAVVVETFLDGPEVSLHAVCSGRDYLMFPSSQDHKPVFDGGGGPNTGGMGTVGPLPWVDNQRMAALGSEFVKPVLEEMCAAGTPFGGLLYPGLKLSTAGPKVIEYNARFGDPETEVYVRLLKSDLLPLLRASVEGNLASVQPEWLADTYVVNVALASGGYPGKYQKGLPIEGLQAAGHQLDVVVFHAGTAGHAGRVVTNGGRVLYVSATGASLKEAQRKAYAAVKLIDFPGMHYRTDIGDGAIEHQPG